MKYKFQSGDGWICFTIFAEQIENKKNSDMRCRSGAISLHYNY